MKTFLKMLLATILGVGILFFLLFVIIASFASISEQEVQIADNSILKLDLNTAIYERSEDNPFASFNPISQSPQSGLGLKNLASAIKHAKNDPKIKGIYLRAGFPQAGHATLKELREELVDFKSEGKFIYSYSEILTQKGLYITSVADSVLVNPEGFLEWKGLSASVTYYKNALDKLGLKPEVLRAKGNKFKSAVEPYMRQDMSPENKMQLDTLIRSIWATYRQDISGSNGLDMETLNSLADDYAISNPKLAAEKGLIDGLAYYDEVMQIMADKVEIEDSKDLKFVSFKKYSQSFNDKANSSYKSDRIAVIIAQGEIVGGNGDEYSIGSERISKAIRKARKNDKVKAVVLRVNSPGGSALASEVIWREIKLTKEVKPVVASMGDLAASGGYYISCFADTIVAQPNTITGSIGAFGLFMTGEELMHDKLGVNISTVKTNEYADLGTFDRALTDNEKNILINSVTQIYSTFKQRVAEGRGLDTAYVETIGQGRVWTGEQAKELGLVDILGDLDDAIEIAKDLAGIEGEYRVVEYPELEDPIQRLLKDLGADYETKMINEKLGEYARYIEILEKAKGMQGYQTRLEYDLVID